MRSHGSAPVPITAGPEQNPDLTADLGEHVGGVEIGAQLRDAIASEHDTRDCADRIAVFVREPAEQQDLAPMNARFQAGWRRDQAIAVLRCDEAALAAWIA